MIGGKRHDLIPSIILLADTMAISSMEFQVKKELPMNGFFQKDHFLFFRVSHIEMWDSKWL